MVEKMSILMLAENQKECDRALVKAYLRAYILVILRNALKHHFFLYTLAW